MDWNRIIDVSEWNNVENWQTVKPNIDAAIIRMGYTYSRNGALCIDKNYVANRKTCKALGIPYSLYYFTNAVNEEEAKREAMLVAYECRDLSWYRLPVFVDSEKVDGLGRADNLDIETRTKCLQVFCDTLQANKVPAGIYCNPDWIQNHIDISRLPYSLWLASWGVEKPQYDNYLIWQYTNRATVPGISGFVDMSSNVHKVTTPNVKDPANTVQKVIDIALAEIGYLEKMNGDLEYLYDKTFNHGYMNYTKYGYEMHKLYPSTMDYPAAWCDCFVDWCFYKAYGISNAKKLLAGEFDDYTVRSIELYKKKNAYYEGNIIPRKGDQIFFKNDLGTPCHTGLVYDVSGSKVYTVEGNTSSMPGVVSNGGCVRNKEYSLSYSKIHGYGRPLYADAT